MVQVLPPQHQLCSFVTGAFVTFVAFEAGTQKPNMTTPPECERQVAVITQQAGNVSCEYGGCNRQVTT